MKASNDLVGQEEIKLGLDGYPEIRKAFETRSAVVVNDTTIDPLMDPVRSQIAKRGLSSIFVVPIIKKESVIGSLFLGTATKLQGGVSDRVYKLCHLVANISANALENAVLFESMTTAKEVFEEFSSELGIGDKATYLKDLFEKGYLEQSNLADATRFIANEIFKEKGLVILDGDDKNLKQLFVPFAKEELLNQL